MLSSNAASISEQLVDHTKVLMYDMNALVSNKLRDFVQDLRKGSNTVFCERIKEQEDFMFRVVSQHTEEVIDKTQHALHMLKEDVQENCVKMQKLSYMKFLEIVCEVLPTL